MFIRVEKLLPVISFGSKRDGETKGKHLEFVQRMHQHGYTERQVRRLVEWYMRVIKGGRNANASFHRQASQSDRKSLSNCQKLMRRARHYIK